jgi:hypothetical protein
MAVNCKIAFSNFYSDCHRVLTRNRSIILEVNRHTKSLKNKNSRGTTNTSCSCYITAVVGWKGTSDIQDGKQRCFLSHNEVIPGENFSTCIKSLTLLTGMNNKPVSCAYALLSNTIRLYYFVVECDQIADCLFRLTSLMVFGWGSKRKRLGHNCGTLKHLPEKVKVNNVEGYTRGLNWI